MRSSVLVLLLFSMACGEATNDDDGVVIITNSSTQNNGNNTDPNNTDPNNTDPNNTDPNNTNPNNTNPNNTNPNNTNPNNTNPNNTNPNNTPGLGFERFSFVEIGFRDPAVTFTPDGTAHYAYAVAASPARLHYGSCTSDCGSASQWQWAQIDESNLINDVRMESDASGRLHMVYEISNANLDRSTIYATCTGNCRGSNWTYVDLTPALNFTHTVWRGSPLVVTPSGAAYLITGGSDINLTQCMSNCGNGANWSSGSIRASGYRSTLAVDGTRLHHFVNNGEGGIVYQTCGGDCTDAANWQESQLFAQPVDGQIRVAVSDGELRVIYNQGETRDPDPAVLAQDGRLLFWTCTSNCLQPASWQGTILAAPGDGIQIDMVTVGPATALTFVAGDLSHTAMVCTGNCLDPASWVSLVIDNIDAMNATLDPYALLCGGTRPVFSGWYVETPVLAISPVTGSALIGAGASLLQQCNVGGQYARIPGMGRAIYVP